MGENIIKLHVPGGAERPCDIPELDNRDTRELSMAVQNVTFVEAGGLRHQKLQCAMSMKLAMIGPYR